MQGSKYAPIRASDYGSKDLNADFRGEQFSVTKGTNVNCDHKILDDSLIDGGEIIATNVVQGDKISCQVIDIDNIFGMGANFILGQFVTDWFLVPGSISKWNFTINYPAKVFAGLYLRIIYKSTGVDSDVWLAVNYKTHRILW